MPVHSQKTDGDEPAHGRLRLLPMQRGAQESKVKTRATAKDQDGVATIKSRKRWNAQPRLKGKPSERELGATNSSTK